MARYNILKLVQQIGVSIGSDEIDELDENTEVADIQSILELTYDDVLLRGEFEFMKNQLRPLEARDAGDTDFGRLRIPTGLKELTHCIVRYRDYDFTEIRYNDLTYLSPVEFTEIVQRRNTTDANITVVNNTYGIPLPLHNDRTPQYWTSFDEEHISFDAFDGDVATGVVATDAVVFGTMAPAVDWADPVAFLPVPEKVEKLVLYEAQSVASLDLRQVQNGKAEQRARRLWSRLIHTNAMTKVDQEEIDYGRKGSTSSGRRW